jgi:integrase
LNYIVYLCNRNDNLLYQCCTNFDMAVKIDYKMENQRVFKKGGYKKISYTMLLDNHRSRYESKGLPTPMVIRITFNRQSIFIPVGSDFSLDDYNIMCEAESDPKSRVMLAKRKKLYKVYNHVESIIKGLAGKEDDEDNIFSLEAFKVKFYGLTANSKMTLYQLWIDTADNKNAKTKECYLQALNRFIKDMGKGVSFDSVTRSLVIKWRTKMLSELSKTTCNIYLRAFSVVCHEAEAQHLIKVESATLFKCLSIRGKNSSNSRKHEYLSVSDWQKLWQFYESEGDGNPIFNVWRSDYKVSRIEALGMMLFMYLGNGMNLRDVFSLRYDNYYYSTGKKQFRFYRHKVADRTAAAEIVFPILPEMRIIIDRYNEAHHIKETDGSLVFPYLKGITDEAEQIRMTALANHVIRDSMKSVSEAVGLSCVPTPTWSRHSFASNLTQAGIDRDYISAQMGHVESSSTTDNYVDHYGYNKMVEYNSKLLHREERSSLIASLKALSGDELKELLAMVGG